MSPFAPRKWRGLGATFAERKATKAEVIVVPILRSVGQARCSAKLVVPRAILPRPYFCGDACGQYDRRILAEAPMSLRWGDRRGPANVKTKLPGRLKER